MNLFHFFKKKAGGLPPEIGVRYTFDDDEGNPFCEKWVTPTAIKNGFVQYKNGGLLQGREWQSDSHCSCSVASFNYCFRKFS